MEMFCFSFSRAAAACAGPGECVVCCCGLPDVRRMKIVQYKRFIDFSVPKPYQTRK